MLQLKLHYNTGVAFSTGTELPTWVLLTLTTAITIAVTAAATTGRLHPPLAAGLILGGAAANLVDRAIDGRVTDYLHLDWFSTFNLADTAITLGAILFLLAARRGSRSDPTSADSTEVTRRWQSAS